MKNGMDTKQTAVEWIEKQLDWLYNDMPEENRIRLFNQAKQMEKEQIMDAYESATLELANERNDYLSEQYYNETYKQ